MSNSSKKLWIVISLGINLILSGIVMAEDVPLSVFQVTYQTIQKQRYFDAVIEPVNQATVSAQTSGRIVQINFDVDDFAPKGSILLRFRNKKQKAALDEAQAGVKEADTLREDARLDFVRINGVYEKKLVSKAIYDKARTAHKTAVQRLEQARARLIQAQEEYDRTIVKAPYDGIVVERHVQVGETAKVGQALITGFSMNSIRAITTVPQSMIGLIHPGKGQETQATIILPDNSHTILTDAKVNRINKIAATYITINPYGDQTTHTFKVRVGLPEDLSGIYPGMFVKIAFVIGEDEHLLVPRQAIVNRSEVTAAYVMQADGKLSFRQIRLGKVFENNLVEVLSGLDAGEQVALNPVSAGRQLKEQQAGSFK